MDWKNLKMKITLLSLRDILIQERWKSYYRKDIHMQERIILNKESITLYDMDYLLVQEMIIYQNGMTDFVQYTIPDYRKKKFRKKEN